MNQDYKRLKYLFRYAFFRMLPKSLYNSILLQKYKRIYNRKFSFDSPVRLSEKLQWLKLNDNSQQKTICADKLLVKDYIADVLPSLKCAKVYQCADCFEKLDFEKLPSSFILKTNHAWKTNVYVGDKTKLSHKDLKRLQKDYNWVLKINFAYWSYYELHYKDIKPMVFAEEIICKCGEEQKLINHEVFCFNGKPEFILSRKMGMCFEQYVFDTNGQKMNFDVAYGGDDENFVISTLKELLYYSKILSSNFKFVRIDFMEVEGDIYFCEMTFTPYSGYIEFNPDIYDLYYGHRLIL